jgi:hypothetical protein
MSAAVVLPLSMYPRLRRAQGSLILTASMDLGAFPLSFDDALPACGPRGGAGRALVRRVHQHSAALAGSELIKPGQ